MVISMKQLFIIAILLYGVTPDSFSQGKPYSTSSVEMIFSTSDYDGDQAIRFSSVLNLQNTIHFDAGPSFGFFTGANVRNVGFIYDESGSTRKKVRTYNIGLPVGVKFGSMKGMFFYAGYEVEFPLNYKEKTFINESKEDKFNTWLSDRTPTLYNSVMGGIQFPYGVNIKFKYYLTSFFDKDYTGTDVNGDPIVYPDANVFYLSVSFMLLKNSGVYYKDEE
jgi:hypothetical protein